MYQDDLQYVLHESKISSVCIAHVTGEARAFLKRVKHTENGGEASRQAIRNEIDILKRFSKETDLAHPFLVNMYGATETNLESLIVLEFCEQGDLFEYMQNQSLSETCIKLCLVELGLAIEHLHSNLGVIHEDLKPENIGISRDGHIRLLDFGVSNVTSVEHGASFGVTSTQGTVEYASPEKLHREPHSFEVDWWAFGVIAFELFFGSLPWSENTREATARAICTCPIELFEVDDESPNEDVEALSFVHGLLTLEKHRRLSHGTGFAAVYEHAFLRAVDMDAVKRLECSPFNVYS